MRQLSCWLLSKGYGEGSRESTAPFKVGGQMMIDKKFPLHVYLELSRSCNYQCKMCVRRKDDNGYMPLSLVAKITEEAAYYGPTSFSLHLYGEPLLSPNWESAIKIIKTVNPKNVVLLTTNGSLMDMEISNKLIKLKVDMVYVSIPTVTMAEPKTLINLANFMEIREENKLPRLWVRTYN